jgi:hypothetical protein
MKKFLCGWCLLFVGVMVTAQQRTIDQAIQGAYIDITRSLPYGDKVIVINFNSSNNALSEYVLDRLAILITNGKKLYVIDRQEGLKFIKDEVWYQYGGDVSEGEMTRIGQQAGAQWIIYGKYNQQVQDFIIHVINVETAIRKVSYNTVIKADKKLDQLLDITQEQQASRQRKKEEEDRQKEAARIQRRQTVANRSTKFILGFRGGMTFMLNQPSAAILQEQERYPVESADALNYGGLFSFYAGINNRNARLGVQLEGNLIFNNGMNLTSRNWEEPLDFSYRSFDIPLLLRIGSGGFSLFAGPYGSIPITPLTINTIEYSIETILQVMSSWGIVGGLSIGFKAGPGYIVLDGRYMYDFNEISFSYNNGDSQPLFRRHGIKATIGYEFWL